MKKKSFATSINTNLEKQMLPRLSLMGYLLMLFSGCALAYAVFFSPYLGNYEEEVLKLPIELETAGFSSEPSIIEEEKISLYMIAAIFAVIGGSCIITAWKKKRAY